MTTSTTTNPWARTLLAVSGYVGLGRLIAEPLSTPPVIGFKSGFGPVELRTGAIGGSASATAVFGVVADVVDSADRGTSARPSLDVELFGGGTTAPARAALPAFPALTGIPEETGPMLDLGLLFAAAAATVAPCGALLEGGCWA